MTASIRGLCRVVGGSLSALLLVLSARDADAGETAPFTIGSRPVWFLMGGVTTGGTVVTQDRGWYVGGEVSAVRLRDGKFFGFYGDGYYELGIRRTYATTGVELGYKFLGIDAGGAARFGGDRVEWGPTGRLFLSVGILTIYGRYAYFVDPLREGNDHVVQIGGMVKVPLLSWGNR